MRPKNKILCLCLIISLFGFPTKVIAEQVEIESVPETKDIKVYAFEQINNKWGSSQWDSFDKLIQKESKWDSEARNPNSSAYGLGQLLNATWETVDCKKTSNKEKQIDCTIKYIESRYDTPKKALDFHLKNNWY